MNENIFSKMSLPDCLKDIINNTKHNIIIPESKTELFDLSLGGKENKTWDVNYDINGKTVREAYVVLCKNGIVANFDDITMRRRDPDSMVIADSKPTDKKTYMDRFGKTFDEDRIQTFDWLKEQGDLIFLPFYAGNSEVRTDDKVMHMGYPAVAVIPANAAFFAAALADLQGFIPRSEIPEYFKPKAVIYVAPPFRLTHFDGRQVVVHNRLDDMHEVFSYNLYPGPSAKKGVYSVLLNIGEQEECITLHASTVRIVTPYEMAITIMHEGASGGGKSEMTEPFHRQADGTLLLGTNIITGRETYVNISDTCELQPVTDDMAIAHTSLQNDGHKLVVADAEDGWFLRVNHIEEYGTEPETEKACIHPVEPLVFLNMQAVPDSTCLIWEHIEDSPGEPCPNPRVIMPRANKKNIIDGAVEVDIRSFGVRTPPSTKQDPNYGIIGMFHILPPALAWLWRLVAPRGYANPSIIDKSGGMKSEGVGSYWPFATGKKVTQANLLLEQILATPSTRYILIPNQYIGAYKVGFAAQWATREYLSRRGGCKFRRESLNESRCPILGYALESIKIDGTNIPKGFLEVNYQSQVGDDAYDAGAKILTDFFKDELKKFNISEFTPLGKRIVEACLNDASVEEYFKLIPKL